ncbi:9655_t:CDS:2 [Ambispora gerdemannii]|uniref:9655_t:CDS:1 n=1 Tax=Ambispora gerdemannii TaxID=144530 RepID=A0A9N9CNS7_9GLOM|nr:9655_t:CDS:2 [Ambispora gerdemannii]
MITFPNTYKYHRITYHTIYSITPQQNKVELAQNYSDTSRVSLSSTLSDDQDLETGGSTSEFGKSSAFNNLIQKDGVINNVDNSQLDVLVEGGGSSPTVIFSSSAALSNNATNNNSKRRYSTPSSPINTGGFVNSIKEKLRGGGSVSRTMQRSEYVELETKEGLEEEDEDHWSSEDDNNNESIKLKKQRKAFLHNTKDDGSADSEQPERNLAFEAIPPLLVAIVWSIITGSLLDIVKHWDAFTHVKELFILVPVLLNLKGNLEMNLASRMSTSANLGELDKPSVRDALVWGNLSLLQVQALIVGAVAGLFSFAEGIIFHPHKNSFYESMLVIVASMLCSALSSLIMGTFMCTLVILCRRFRINPDNIACPMASSLGDLLTLIILSVCGEFLLRYMETFTSTALFILLAIAIPYWVRLVSSNKYVRDLLTSGWSPLFFAMIISSMAGLTLEQYIEKYSGLASLQPVLTALSGNLGSIYASRISTRLHSSSGEEDYRKSEIVLFIIHIPIEILFMLIVWWFDVGHVHLTWSLCIMYLFVSVISVSCALLLAKRITLWLWHRKYDPDNYSLPYLTAVVDVMGTTLLVLAYLFLTAVGLASEEQAIVSE